MNSSDWNAIVAAADSKAYHLHQWGDLLEQVHRHQVFRLSEDGGVLALAYVKSRLFGNRLISLPFADYGGPCSRDEGVAEGLVARSLELARELDADFLEVRAPHPRYFPLLETSGFERRDDYFTYVLEVGRSVADLWKFVGDKNRNMVRKAERNGVELRWAQDRSDVQHFYHLYLDTMKRLGSPPQPFAFFGKMWDMLRPERILLPLAWKDNQCVAGGVYFVHQDTIHHAYGCSRGEYLGIGVNDLVQWQIMKWGSEHGLKYLDFGRSREGSGVDLYKKKWGGEKVAMPYFYLFRKRRLELRQEIQYQRLSQLWRRYLPRFLARRLGPLIIRQIG